MTTSPTASIHAPTNGASVTSPVNILGSAEDNVALDRVMATVTNSSGQFWNGASFQSGFSIVLMNGTDNWSNSIDLRRGTYTLQPVAFDSSNNWGATNPVMFTVN